LVKLQQILLLERKKVTGYRILDDMRYSYGRACIVASHGTTIHITIRQVIGT
jgi:hypothetical protein